MAKRRYLMALAKFIVATAWADGTLSRQELNALKDLLFRLPELSGEEWSELEVYIDSPVSSAERTRLLEELVQCLRSPADKAFAKTVIREVVEADGKVSPTEKQVLDEVQSALENADVGVWTRMKQLLGPSVSRRTQTASQAANREEDIEEFVKNKIFFRLKRRLESEDKKMDLDERDLEKLCLAGGLMARIAWVDQEISEAEKLAIRKNLHEKWGISETAAEVVAEVAASSVARGLDYFRLTRSFFECTERPERVAFLESLFSVANAYGKTSFEEIEEIRTLAKGLKLDHQEFIQAKLEVPREDRSGL